MKSPFRPDLDIALSVLIILLFAAMACMALVGCSTIVPNKLQVGVADTSHLLQHFEHEGWGGAGRGMAGCQGPTASLRWETDHGYLQMSDMYCVHGSTDDQKEVAHIEAGVSISLK